MAQIKLSHLLAALEADITPFSRDRPGERGRAFTPEMLPTVRGRVHPRSGPGALDYRPLHEYPPLRVQKRQQP